MLHPKKKSPSFHPSSIIENDRACSSVGSGRHTVTFDQQNQMPFQLILLFFLFQLLFCHSSVIKKNLKSILYYFRFRFGHFLSFQSGNTGPGKPTAQPQASWTRGAALCWCYTSLYLTKDYRVFFDKVVTVCLYNGRLHTPILGVPSKTVG